MFAEIKEEAKFTKAAEKKNTTMIRKLYIALLKKITKNLNQVVKDMDDFHDTVSVLFDAGNSIREAKSVRKVFQLLSEKSYWNFLDVSDMESIVEEFGGELVEESSKLINEYKEKLKGFKTAFKVAEFMERDREKEDEIVPGEEYTKLTEEQTKYDEVYRTKLSIKLAEKKHPSVKISLQSLLYVEKLWDSLCGDFNLPSLPHVLDDIIKGSIIIHWIVQHQVTWRILEEVGSAKATEFFEKEAITNVCLEGVCVYNQKSGVRAQKV